MQALEITCALLLTASAAAAQPTPPAALPRADVQAAIGWQNLRGEPTVSGNNWINSVYFGDAAVGWYWTEHLRTQIDAGIGSTGRTYRLVESPSGLQPSYQSIDTSIRPATFAVSQQYQFFHNAVFHPHVGSGVIVRSEAIRDDFAPLLEFNPATGQSTVVRPRHVEQRSRTQLAAIADVGFKAYLSQRAFFVSDARFTVRHSVDGVLLRFGFGLDF